MQEKIVSNYVGRHIKLVQNGYALKGKIRKIDSGSIIFDSDQGIESAFELECIQAIILLQ